MSLEYEIIKELSIWFVLGGIAAIGAYLKSIKRDQKTMHKCLDKNSARSIRHGNAIIEIGEHLDEEGQRLHPDRSPRPLKDRLDRIVRDKDGNL